MRTSTREAISQHGIHHSPQSPLLKATPQSKWFWIIGRHGCVSLINVYGLFHDCKPFWDSFFDSSWTNVVGVILGGDLNITLSQREVWGPHARQDTMSSFFSSKFEAHGLVDVQSVKLVPTWRNNRIGEVAVSKRMDCFMVLEDVVRGTLSMHSWVESGGNSNYSPIVLSLEAPNPKPPTPFKFTPCG